MEKALKSAYTHMKCFHIFLMLPPFLNRYISMGFRDILQRYVISMFLITFFYIKKHRIMCLTVTKVSLIKMEIIFVN